jgi:hypothetical protein
MLIKKKSIMDKTTKHFLNIKLFPPDVIAHICSFGYPEYKEHMNKICYQLTHYTGYGLLEYNLYLLHEDYIYLYGINYVRCMVDFLHYAVDNEVLEKLFIQCTKCCCCSKHCHNRPTNYYSDEVSIGENFEPSEQCHCNCRQLSRSIKRVQLLQSSELPESKYKKKKKCRRKSTFNIHFIHSHA